ncbi:phosphopantetheine-binding protein [Plantactinospora sp. KBS50]|uniref:phosphopantetheine-binding protein n=1 Tax=Plantactinospora sp. KBS50 TaxID=2024580 RepID=UPI001E6178CC|nr:phosphopantetheine-binding protein [Plantactinospora sp. KBS50]
MTETSARVIPRDERELSSDYRAPSTSTEHTLIEMWRRHLHVEPIGVDDDFFELGGHSLLAADLLVATEREVGVHVPASTLFLQPTIAELAEAVDRLRDGGAGTCG